MSKWQPIETAPKDGTAIDVWEFCHDSRWRPNNHGIKNGTRCIDVAWKDRMWQQYNVDIAEWYQLGSAHYTISHWMPYPEPPHESATPIPAEKDTVTK